MISLRESMILNLKAFIKQSSTDSQKISAYINYYRGLNVTTSFGFGGFAFVPWISFCGDNQTTKNGIYPVILYYKSIKLLILAYGVSSSNIPELEWNFIDGNKQTIKSFLLERKYDVKRKEIKKYLDSYVYKAYDINENLDYGTITDDLDTIIGFYQEFLSEKYSLEKNVPFAPSKGRSEKNEFYKQDMADDETIKLLHEPTPSNDNKVTSYLNLGKIISSIKSTGLIYDDDLIKRFAYSLLTKPFVILSGLAGSGKTQLALAFAKALVENEEEQLCFVPVGADWTNREPLLGYPNALKRGDYVPPESGVLELLIECNKPENSNKPYFLILDEMNLSYVERYFADFLSVMESHKEIHLWKEEKHRVPHSVKLTKNLFIIGTINVDETTYMFSPKVLDRANVIEFKVDEKDMIKFLSSNPKVDIEKANGNAAPMAADFVRIASEKVEFTTIANETLKSFFVQLKKVNAEFGYRSATEIGRFISLAKDSMGDDKAVDAAIVQKLLPKLHGSRKKIVPVLKELWTLCGISLDMEEMEILEVPDDAKYPLTANKIVRMYKCAIDNGFTSFAEA